MKVAEPCDAGHVTAPGAGLTGNNYSSHGTAGKSSSTLPC